jgi:hypothetical protein
MVRVEVKVKDDKHLKMERVYTCVKSFVDLTCAVNFLGVRVLLNSLVFYEVLFYSKVVNKLAYVYS